MNKQEVLLLDTNTVLYLINGDEQVFQLIHEKSVAINFITEIELLSWPSITPKLHKVITSFIKDVQYYDYSYRIKQSTILLKQKFKLKLGDAFIAATALEYDITLVSADKVFSRVSELKLITFLPST